jgi:ubiquinone/menaquinone biosynthesis C-methylase UbiE
MSVKKFEGTREVVKYALEKGYLRGRVLDLGAGQAKYRNIIKEKTESYTTFDLIAGQNVDVVGDINHTGFDAGSFDTVICTQVFEHIPEPHLAAKEIARVLKSGGFCLLTAPFLEPYHADPHDYFRYTTEGLSFLLKNEGLEIMEVDGYGPMYFVLSELIRLTLFNPYKKARRGSYRITKILQSLARFFNRFSSNQTIYASTFVFARKK